MSECVIADAAERQLAIDPTRSFCVSAPAGSGKTELLIQRFLALLARVDEPEKIVAITFTRKAAAEMRERLTAALQAARTGAAADGSHAQTTRDLASAVLARDAACSWQITANSARLRVRTIDSFCADLARQMPVLSSLGGAPQVSDDSSELYREAIEHFFSCLGTRRDPEGDIAALLMHYDNNRQQLASLLENVLARRDQWRGYMGLHHSAEESEAYLRQVTTELAEDHLDRLYASLEPFIAALDPLLAWRASNLETAVAAALPPAQQGALPAWRDLRSLLLTREGTWRRTIDKRNGFPAGKGRHNAMRGEMLSLIAELSAVPDLAEMLLTLDTLPEQDADTESWRVLLHLSRILPLLAASLLLVFRQRGEVDHAQVTMSALDALGADERPTDIALRLDYQIEHILVDEFQDTSNNQFELVRRLTRGWREHNTTRPMQPRTVMLVGDGMQSIYGFRDANVSLFLKARDEGFNGLRLEPLQLSCNFRSDAPLVNWVNRCLGPAFPVRDDVARGSIRFAPGSAIRPADRERPASLHLLHGDNRAQAEVALLSEHIRELRRSSPGDSIAILARTRAQLPPLLGALRALDIDFAAQDIARLDGEPVVIDLLSLCRVLADRYDRLSAFALLRSPLCGLLLADLHVLAAVDADAVPRTLLLDEDMAAALSADGCSRLRHLAAVLDHAESVRDRRSLRAWVESTWLRLGGPDCYANPSAGRDAARFLTLLETSEQRGPGLDLEWLTREVQSLYAHPGNPDAAVQVMTLHKAKGLQFDHVIIPNLARQTRGGSGDLFRWDEHVSSRGEQQFLLAADDLSSSETPGLYNYLGREQMRKTRLETTRLLYVGVTRAVKSLCLTALVTRDERSGEFKPPPANSLLAAWWPAAATEASVHDTDTGAAAVTARTQRVAAPLQRLVYPPQLPAQLTTPVSDERQGTEAVDIAGAETENRVRRAEGNAVHALLEQLARRDNLPECCGGPELALIDYLLQSSGLQGVALERASARIAAGVDATLRDKVGRWLLDSHHVRSRQEFALTVPGMGEHSAQLVIDRCFIDRDSGELWVVDYKTSTPVEGDSLQSFLARETDSYRPQLARYRSAVAAWEGTDNIRCALYFTQLGYLHEVGV